MSSDLLKSGASWLAGKLKANAGESVTYIRGATSATLTATLGTSLLKLGDGAGGVRMQRTDRDFIFTTADLVAAGITMPPLNGDTITIGLGGVTERYAALPYSRDEPLYRYCDPFEVQIRIHTKRVG